MLDHVKPELEKICSLQFKYLKSSVNFCFFHINEIYIKYIRNLIMVIINIIFYYIPRVFNIRICIYQI